LTVEVMRGVLLPFVNELLGNAFSTSLYALYPSKLACPDCSVGWESIPRKVIAYSNFAKSGAIVLSPFACGEIALENSVVLCIVAHPSTTQVAARYTAAMACWPTEAFFCLPPSERAMRELPE